MSLQELRDMAEAESDASELDSDNITSEESEKEVLISDSDESTEDVQQDEEESEDFELELEDEVNKKPKPKYTDTQALTHKLTKTRKRAQRAEGEADALRERVDQLEKLVSEGASIKAQEPIAQNQVANPPQYPDLYSSEINGDRVKHNQAMARYTQDLIEYNQRVQEPRLEAERYQQKLKQDITNKALALSEDAASFIQGNKIKADVVIDAIESAKDEIDASAGMDGAFVHLLSSLDDGQAKVAYHLGRNEQARNRLKELIANDPSGLKAVNYLSKLTSLKPKNRAMSKAPEPDEPIKGDAKSVSSSRLQSMYDKESDPQKMLAIRKKARSLGVSLD